MTQKGFHQYIRCLLVHIVSRCWRAALFWVTARWLGVIVSCRAANITTPGHIKLPTPVFLCLFGSQVKEKETARKEYKQAIEKGHGAYLMDQDAPVCPPSAHIIEPIQALSLAISNSEILNWAVSITEDFTTNFHSTSVIPKIIKLKLTSIESQSRDWFQFFLSTTS